MKEGVTDFKQRNGSLVTHQGNGYKSKPVCAGESGKDSESGASRYDTKGV